MGVGSVLSLATGASSVFGGLKIAAILLAVVAGAGSLSYCTYSLTSGAAAKAEADRLEDIARQNHETNVKLRKDTADARSAESRYRAERDKALAQARAAIAARRAAERTKGEAKTCPVGCVISR